MEYHWILWYVVVCDSMSSDIMSYLGICLYIMAYHGMVYLVYHGISWYVMVYISERSSTKLTLNESTKRNAWLSLLDA